MPFLARPTPAGTAIFALLWLPLGAWACGSMGLDDPRIRATLLTAIFLPMIVLVPIEMGILKRVGGLEGRVITAYLACLPAKAAGVFFVSMAAKMKLVENVFAAEAAYSTGHFVLSYLVLSLVPSVKGKAPALTALLISTVIPWLYSLGLWLLIVGTLP